MSVKIRLTRTGKSAQVSYRIVAQDTRSKRDGKFLEMLGFYNPSNKPSLEIDKEKLAAWTKKGAKPTLAVASLLENGILPAKKVSKKKVARDLEKSDKAEAAKAAAGEPKPTESTETAETSPSDAPPAEKAGEAEATKAEEKPAEQPVTQSKETEEKAAPANP